MARARKPSEEEGGATVRPLAKREGTVDGMVISRRSGFYDVQLPSGDVVLATLRGNVRKRGPVLTGDRVKVRLLADGRGVVEEVGPRVTCLARPPLANVTRLVAVVPVDHPDFFLLDRVLVLGEAAGLCSVVCINKVDLDDEGQARAWAERYRQVGYPVVLVSARTGQGMEELAGLLTGHVSTLSGPSGAGKSSILNALVPAAGAEVGEMAARIGRGRHTTRVVRLLPLPGGGLLADTPGFSRLDLVGIGSRDLDRWMPDIGRWADRCQFGESCLHRGEEGCAVARAVEEGRVSKHRYQHYRRLLDEVLAMEVRRYS
ncbi:MAG: ribosome small subunit-dependent GTPase A [Limnochordaceae bacterium]|nr:ribosome small subunit-dependent GTPase A [Limnochordaceae bacterium]